MHILISLIFSRSYYVWFYTRFAKPPAMVQSGGYSPVQRQTGTQTRVNQTIFLVLYSFIFKTFFVKLNTYIHQYTGPNPNQHTTNTWNCELWFYILEIFWYFDSGSSLSWNAIPIVKLYYNPTRILNIQTLQISSVTIWCNQNYFDAQIIKREPTNPSNL